MRIKVIIIFNMFISLEIFNFFIPAFELLIETVITYLDDCGVAYGLFHAFQLYISDNTVIVTRRPE